MKIRRFASGLPGVVAGVVAGVFFGLSQSIESQNSLLRGIEGQRSARVQADTDLSELQRQRRANELILEDARRDASVKGNQVLELEKTIEDLRNPHYALLHSHARVAGELVPLVGEQARGDRMLVWGEHAVGARSFESPFIEYGHGPSIIYTKERVIDLACNVCIGPLYSFQPEDIGDITQAICEVSHGSEKIVLSGDRIKISPLEIKNPPCCHGRDTSDTRKHRQIVINGVPLNPGENRIALYIGGNIEDGSDRRAGKIGYYWVGDIVHCLSSRKAGFDRLNNLVNHGFGYDKKAVAEFYGIIDGLFPPEK
jgi:hypothetical protein